MKFSTHNTKFIINVADRVTLWSLSSRTWTASSCTRTGKRLCRRPSRPRNWSLPWGISSVPLTTTHPDLTSIDSVTIILKTTQNVLKSLSLNSQIISPEDYVPTRHPDSLVAVFWERFKLFIHYVLISNTVFFRNYILFYSLLNLRLLFTGARHVVQLISCRSLWVAVFRQTRRGTELLQNHPKALPKRMRQQPKCRPLRPPITVLVQTHLRSENLILSHTFYFTHKPALWRSGIAIVIHTRNQMQSKLNCRRSLQIRLFNFLAAYGNLKNSSATSRSYSSHAVNRILSIRKLLNLSAWSRVFEDLLLKSPLWAGKEHNTLRDPNSW